MMRLIDADALKEKIRLSGFGMYYDAYEVQEMPTIDAVVLPCKIGDPVYIIRDCSCHVYGRWNNPTGKCLGKVYLGKKQRAYHCGCVSEAKFELKHLADFGKLVFLTREEAEAVLAKSIK